MCSCNVSEHAAGVEVVHSAVVDRPEIKGAALPSSIRPWIALSCMRSAKQFASQIMATCRSVHQF